MRLWVNSEAAPEGKFLVVRRDGTIPAWPHFVLGARDAAVPAALRAYADKAEELEYDYAMVADVCALADQFDAYREEHGPGDADAAPHRIDDARVIARMRKGGHIFGDEGSHYACQNEYVIAKIKFVTFATSDGRWGIGDEEGENFWAPFASESDAMDQAQQWACECQRERATDV